MEWSWKRVGGGQTSKTSGWTYEVFLNCSTTFFKFLSKFFDWKIVSVKLSSLFDFCIFCILTTRNAVFYQKSKNYNRKSILRNNFLALHLQLHSLIFFHDITPVFLFFFYRLITRLKSISQRSYTFDADILYGKNKKFLPLQSLLPSHIEVSTENCCTFSFWWCFLRYIHANYFFHFQITFYQRNNTIFGLPNTSFDPYLYFVLYFPFNTFHTNTFNNSTWWFNFFIH